MPGFSTTNKDAFESATFAREATDVPVGGGIGASAPATVGNGKSANGETPRRAALSRIAQEIPRLRRYARFLVASSDDADDVVQQCLVQAVAKIEQWRPGTNLTAWLFVIMRNVVFSNVRRSRRRPVTLGLEDWDQATAVSGGQEEAFMLSALEQAIDRLPPDQRDVIVLCGVEGLSYEEAAEVLDVPVGTIRSRLSRARGALREDMDGGQRNGKLADHA